MQIHLFILTTPCFLYQLLSYIINNSYHLQRPCRPPGPSSTFPTPLPPTSSIYFCIFHTYNGFWIHSMCIQAFHVCPQDHVHLLCSHSHSICHVCTTHQLPFHVTASLLILQLTLQLICLHSPFDSIHICKCDFYTCLYFHCCQFFFPHW